MFGILAISLCWVCGSIRQNTDGTFNILFMIKELLIYQKPELGLSTAQNRTLPCDNNSLPIALTQIYCSARSL